MNRKMIVAAAAIFAFSLTIISFSGLFTARAPAPGEPVVKYQIRLYIPKYGLSVMFDEWKGLNMSCDVVEIVQVGQDGKEFSIHYPSGPTHYGALVLRHGMSSNNVAWDWMASNYVDGSFEKIPVSITVFDEAMNPVVAFELYGAFPSAWSLNSGAKGIVIEELVVQYDSLRLMSWYP